MPRLNPLPGHEPPPGKMEKIDADINAAIEMLKVLRDSTADVMAALTTEEEFRERDEKLTEGYAEAAAVVQEIRKLKGELQDRMDIVNQFPAELMAEFNAELDAAAQADVLPETARQFLQWVVVLFGSTDPIRAISPEWKEALFNQERERERADRQKLVESSQPASLVSVIPLPANGEELDELRTKAAQLQAKCDRRKSMIRELQCREESAVTLRKDAEGRLEVANEWLKESEAECQAAKHKVKQRDAQIAKLQTIVHDLRQEIESLREASPAAGDQDDGVALQVPSVAMLQKRVDELIEEALERDDELAALQAETKAHKGTVDELQLMEQKAAQYRGRAKKAEADFKQQGEDYKRLAASEVQAREEAKKCLQLHADNCAELTRLRIEVDEYAKRHVHDTINAKCAREEAQALAAKLQSSEQQTAAMATEHEVLKNAVKQAEESAIAQRTSSRRLDASLLCHLAGLTVSSVDQTWMQLASSLSHPVALPMKEVQAESWVFELPWGPLGLPALVVPTTATPLTSALEAVRLALADQSYEAAMVMSRLCQQLAAWDGEIPVALIEATLEAIEEQLIMQQDRSWGFLALATNQVAEILASRAHSASCLDGHKMYTHFQRLLTQPMQLLSEVMRGRDITEAKEVLPTQGVLVLLDDEELLMIEPSSRRMRRVHLSNVSKIQPTLPDGLLRVTVTPPDGQPALAFPCTGSRAAVFWFQVNVAKARMT